MDKEVFETIAVWLFILVLLMLIIILSPMWLLITVCLITLAIWFFLDDED